METVTDSTRGIGYPILLQAAYSKGTMYVLTIPDKFGDLYNLPPSVLNPIRTAVAGDLPVRLEGPAQSACSNTTTTSSSSRTSWRRVVSHFRPACRLPARWPSWWTW